MKKFVSILIIICLVFGAAITYTGCGANDAAESETSPEPSAEPSESVDDTETETASVPQLDFEALYASHDADEVVMTMDGEDVTWEEYFYWLYYSGVQVNNYINQMAANMSAYGMNVTWDDAADDSGISFKDYVVQLAEDNIRQIHSIKKFSAENDVTLTEDNLKAIEEQRKTDMVNLCGEEVSDEEFAEFLKSTYYLPIKVYDDMNEINYLYQNCFAKLYGEDGEKLSDEKAEAYLKDSGYMNAAHILFMTVDPSTGEALDDETIAEKKALADKFAAELAGITDTEKLQERFAEIKDEYCEDTGKEAYPDGYIFTPGTMVTEFEDTVNALEDYQVSEPVESRYGYHIIMRLPLTIDTVLKTSDSGTPLTARALAANQEYGEKLDACNDGIEIVYTDAFTGFGIADYIK
mgnify:FL=1